MSTQDSKVKRLKVSILQQSENKIMRLDCSALQLPQSTFHVPIPQAVDERI
jgi:hypothetical protein